MSSTEAEALQLKHNQLIDAVAQMRHYQEEWRKWHASDDKTRMHKWQRRVDELIAGEVKQRKAKQGNIF